MAEFKPTTRNTPRRGVQQISGSILIMFMMLFCWQQEAHATHAMGGDITYECVGPNLYKVSLSFFRDCNGVEAPTNCTNGRRFRVFSPTCGADFTRCFELESVEVITPICDAAPDRCQTTAGEFGVERYRFSRVIDLSTWAGCGNDWTVEWELCCRNNAITSLNNPGSRNLYLSATLNNTLTPCNRSPRFLNDPVPFGCVGQPMVYNHGVSDLDGDMVTFELAPARGNDGVAIPYNAGYSHLQPVITNGGADAVQIDPATGTITFVPSIQQFAVVSVLVKEFRNGIQIGTYIRDVQFAIIACNNSNPVVSGINGTNSFTYDVCAGEQFCFTVNSSDADAGQVVTLEWNNAIPGASFTTTNGIHPTGTFCWTPTTANIGSQLFTVTATDNACTLNGSGTQGFVINITPPFTAAVAGSNQSVCSANATLSAQLPWPQVQGTWSVVSGTGTFGSATSPNTTVTGLTIGPNVFRWSVNYGSCDMATSDVTVTRFNPGHPSANAGGNQMLCTPNNQTTLAANAAIAPAVGTWTVVGGGGTFTNPNSPTTQVTGLPVGQNQLRWTINNGPCGTTSNTMTVSVYDYAQPAANAGPDQLFCSIPASVQLGALPNNGTWTVVSGTGIFADPTNRNTTVTGLSMGVNRFGWIINNGPCDPPSTADQVDIIVFDPAAAPANAGPPQQICAATTTMAANVPMAPATGIWTLVSGSGTIATPSSPTTTINNVGFGNNVFRWTISNGPCGTTQSQVTITRFNPGAAAANAGPDQNLCTASGSTFASTTLAGNTAAIPATGSWSVITGAATFANAASPTTGVSGLPAGVNTLRWTINNGPCTPPTTFDDVVINVFDRTAPAANAGPDQDFCGVPGTLALGATAAVVPAVGTWSVISGAGSFTDPNSATTTVTGAGFGTHIYRWSVSNGPCPGGITTDDVVIRIFSPENSLANAGPDQELCGISSAILAGSALTAPATGLWAVVSGTATIANPTAANASISNVGIGVTVLSWTVNNGPCGTSTDQVTLTRYATVDPPANAGPDQFICVPVAPNMVMMAGSSVTPPAQGTWSLVSGNATITSPNSPTTMITGLTVGVHELMWSVNNGTCASGQTTDLMRIYVHDALVPGANAGVDRTQCSESGTMLMTAVPPPFPATGEWMLINGTGIIADPFDPTTLVTGLEPGQNIFQWTQNNGACGTTTDQVSLIVYDPTHPDAFAGADQGICTDEGNSIMLHGSQVTFPATGMWTVTGGVSPVIDDPTSNETSVTGLVPDVYLFTWTVNNGTCDNAITSSTTTVTVADGDAQAAMAGADQVMCASDEGVTMNANEPAFPATGLWTVVQGSAQFSDETAHDAFVTELAVGLNVLQWSVDNLDCGVTFDQVTVLVFDPEQPAANAGDDQSLCTPVTSTTMSGSPLIFPAQGQWTLIGGTGIIANPSSPTTTISGLGIGENVFQWQVNNGACEDPITTDVVSIFIFDEQAPVANAGPDQEICTPQASVTMSATVPIGSAIGTWTVVSGGGSITSPNSPTTTITALPIGINVFAWSIDNGSCGISSDQVTILVFDQNNPVAAAGDDQFLCTPATSTTMAGSAVTVPATGQWILVSGSGILTDPTAPNSGVTGLAVGENIFQWTVSNGPCANSVTSDQVSIFLYLDENPIADAGGDQEYCSPVDSATLTGSNVVFPATSNWQLVSGSGTIATPTATSTTVTGLAVGVNTFSYTVDNGPCATGVTTDQVSILIYDEDQPMASAGDDQFLCTPQTSTTLAGSMLIIPATGMWTVINGTASFADAGSPTTAVSNLSIGENILRWTVSNGPCEGSITFADVSIFVYDSENPLASAGDDQQICGPVDIATLQGSAVTFPATGTWTLVAGTGSITDPNSPGTTVTDLGFGENVFEWTVDNGPCDSGITSDQVTIILFDSSNPEPYAGPDQEICTPLNAVTLQASPVNFPATGMWELLNGAGTISDPSDPNTQVSDLEVGENVFMWTVMNGVCESGFGTDVVSIYVFDENNPAAFAGDDQELCTNDLASSTLSGSPVTFPATGTWTVVDGDAIIVNPNDPNSAVLDLAVGETVLMWTVDNGPCDDGITTDLVSIFVFDADNAIADAGMDQDLCTPVGAIQLNGSAVTFPATGTWALVSGTGSISDVNDPAATITGMTPGISILEWTVSNGPCDNGVTTDQVTINLFDENQPVANAGPDQQLCTPETTTTLQGSAVTSPGTGMWTLVSGSGNFVDPTAPNSLITGLTVGENVLAWTVSNGPCANGVTVDMVSIFVFDQNNPDAFAGPDQGVCTPLTNAIMAGSAITFPAQGTWSLVTGQGDIADQHDPLTNVTNLGIGDNVFMWTVDNGSCANGITSSEVTITLFDANAPPANAGPDQQLCAPDDAVVLDANSPVGSAIGTWTLVQGQGSIDALNDPNTSVSGLAVGENIFAWTLESGECVTTSDQVSIFVFDPENPVANAGMDQQLCVPQDSTFMAGSALIFPATGTWTTISGDGMPKEPGNPGTLVTGMQVGENIFQWEVSNGPCANSLTVDLVTVTIYDDVTVAANAGPDLETCLPLTSMQLQGVMPPAPAQGTWSVIAGEGVFADLHDPQTLVTGLVQGVNTFVWTLSWDPCPNNGILTDTVNVLVYDPLAPIADAGFDQLICGAGESTMEAAVPVTPGVGTWTVLVGNALVSSVNDPSSPVTGLDVGVHTFLWTVYNGMCGFGPPSSDTIRISIFDDQAPAAATGPDIFECTPVVEVMLQANEPVYPGTGLWISLGGTGTLVDATDPNTMVTGLVVGVHEFRWNLDNGPCGHTSADISVMLYGGEDDEANAGPDQVFCTPVTSTNLAGNAVAFPGAGTWTLVSGTGDIADPTSPTTGVSGLSVGANVFEWSIVNGPCGNSSDQVVITIHDDNHPAANAGAGMQLCSPVGSMELQAGGVTFPATGMWTVVSGSATIADPTSPNSAISGLPVGVTILEWTVSNGPCPNGITSDQVAITVFNGDLAAAAAGPDQAYCSPVVGEVTMMASAVAAPATGIWSVSEGPATLASPNDMFSVVEGLGLGGHLFLWTVDNGACGTTSDEVAVNVYDSAAPAAYAGPDQEHCQDMTTIQLNADPAQSTTLGVWSVLQGTGNVMEPGSWNTLVTDMQIGDHQFVWTLDNGECGSTWDTVYVWIKDCLTLRIPDAFSPNGDGVNDMYVIENITSYPDSRFTVFNRWGSKVLDRKPYTNDWDGSSQYGAVFGERLPESTYYYVLEVGEGHEPYTGFIFLRR